MSLATLINDAGVDDSDGCGVSDGDDDDNNNNDNYDHIAVQPKMDFIIK